MNYAKISVATNTITKYPAYPQQDYPVISFPAQWAGGTIGTTNYIVIADSILPSYGWNENITEGQPVFVEGVWRKSWVKSLKTKDDMKQLVSARRWNEERAGITYNMNQYATDDTSQTKYLGILMALTMNNNFTVNWKTEGGSFITLHGADIMALTSLVQSHVQLCFNNEDALRTAIDSAADDAALLAININSGWPA